MKETPEHSRFGSPADLIFQVPPDATTFDTVRKAAVNRLRSDYADVIHGPVRQSVRLDSIEITPDGSWDVRGVFDVDDPFQFEAEIDGCPDARHAVLDHVFGYIDDSYAAVDADGVTVDTVSIHPAAWFVDASVPVTVDR